MKINHPINPNKWTNLLYRADCKYALQHLIENDVQVDLIYLDPPFNSNRNYNILYEKGRGALQKAFHDMWTITCQTQQMMLDFREQLSSEENISPIVKSFLNTWINSLVEKSGGGGGKDSNMIVYLIYMTERLILLHKILKDTGSIYLHCDPTASHYLKIIIDGIFGSDNFVNEIIWSYKTGGVSKKWFAKKHDIILFYAKNYKKKYFNTTYQKSYLDTKFFKPHQKKSKELNIKKDYMGMYRLIHRRDVWDDINALHPNAVERKGYPTQKPISLLDIIIKASCHKDGIILDPFCGCGTSIESAITNKKRWIGIDISNNATDIIKESISKHSVKDYEIIQGNPATLLEYQNLNPYEKQEWLINTIGGFCNPRKTGDKGIDGELTVHGGFDSKSKDIWHKVIFSVKTGNQCKPEFLRELIGTMKIENAIYGILIMDKDPTDKMMFSAQSRKQIEYQYDKKLPPQYFSTVQIYTSQQIIDGATCDLPPTINKIKEYRKYPTIDFN